MPRTSVATIASDAANCGLVTVLYAPTAAHDSTDAQLIDARLVYMPWL
jgi:hypothetical protein